MARTRSTEKAAELAAAKAELARLQAMKAAGAPPLPADQPPRAVSDRSAIEEELAAARAERDALLELKREKEAREQAEAKATMARTRSAEKAAELAAAKAELARLQTMKMSTVKAESQLDQATDDHSLVTAKQELLSRLISL